MQTSKAEHLNSGTVFFTVAISVYCDDGFATLVKLFDNQIFPLTDIFSTTNASGLNFWKACQHKIVLLLIKIKWFFSEKYTVLG